MEEPINQPIKRPWYKKKLYILSLAVASIFATSAFGHSGTPSNTSAPGQVQGVNTQTQVQVIAPQPKAVISPLPLPVQPPSSSLSNDNYYRNTAGNSVHSPAYSNSVPAGASAKCGDETYSFSQSRRGTCSHHGGVSEWY